MRYLSWMLLLVSCGPKAASPSVVYDGLDTAAAIVRGGA